MSRVAALMESWARERGLSETEIARWTATGWLHDALRDAPPAELIPLVAESERDLPLEALHGPAAAGQLEGQVDPAVVSAIRHHTLGHPELDPLGRALYLADYLEPGRRSGAEEWAELRDRVVSDPGAVMIEVVSSRISHLLDARLPIHDHTIRLWTSLLSGNRP
jgi:2-amino-4-hydroxy-6-hydroxymethyldihydropteridine diphosphokinase